MKAASEEYARILDVIGRYAVYRAGVGFSCKKQVDVTAKFMPSKPRRSYFRIFGKWSKSLIIGPNYCPLRLDSDIMRHQNMLGVQGQCLRVQEIDYNIILPIVMKKVLKDNEKPTAQFWCLFGNAQFEEMLHFTRSSYTMIADIAPLFLIMTHNA